MSRNLFRVCGGMIRVGRRGALTWVSFQAMRQRINLRPAWSMAAWGARETINLASSVGPPASDR